MEGPCQVTELLADWYKMAQTTFLQIEILSKDICAYEDEIDTFAVALKSSQVGNALRFSLFSGEWELFTIFVSQEKYDALLGEVLVTVRESQEQEEKTAAAMVLRQQTTSKQARHPRKEHFRLPAKAT